MNLSSVSNPYEDLAHPDSPSAEQLMERLRKVLLPYKRVAIACSGGVDSTLLAVAASRILGSDNVLMLTAQAPMMPRSDQEDVLILKKLTGANHRIVELPDQILDEEPFKSNPPDRCYYCKKIIFNQLITAMQEEGFSVLCDGTNADDLGEFRPGLQALDELLVVSPLALAQFTKAEIRLLAGTLCPDYAAKPAMACLATRIPTNTPVTLAALKRIDQAESALRRHGLSQVRVRDHGGLARVELDTALLKKGISSEMIELLTQTLTEAGFTYLTLDLQGYRTGSMNQEQSQ